MAIQPAAGEEDVSVQFVCMGAWKGAVALPSYDCATAGDLRKKIAEQSGRAVSDVKLIASGARLEDDNKLLKDYRVRLGAKVIVLGGASAASILARQEDCAKEEEDREARLKRLKAAAEAMAGRSGGSDASLDSYDFALENQAGTALNISDPQERKALIMGLALHQKGRATMKREDFSTALQELLLAEEAFAMVLSSLLDSVDNLGMLFLDISWCCFKLQDAGKLSECRERLARARTALQRAHGPTGERLRTLHGNFKPELAIYARLELLEGVAAYHTGLKGEVRAHLQAAVDLCRQLDVSDTNISTLVSMGFEASQAIRALRFSGGDLEKAVDIAFEQEKAVAERKRVRKEEMKRAKEQRLYGKTAAGNRVDMQLLERLAVLGYERRLGAEALRQTDNDIQAAIDILVDPERNLVLQQSRRAAEATSSSSAASGNAGEAAAAALMGMGFQEEVVRAVLRLCREGDGIQRALEMLTGGVQGATVLAATLSRVLQGNLPPPANDGTGGPDENSPEARRSPSPSAQPQDKEMEEELAAELNEADPMASYDVDVREEADAALTYLAMLAPSP